MKYLYLSILSLLFIQVCFAQEQTNYQTPPEEIVKLVDVKRPPLVLVDDKGEYMLLRYLDYYKTITQLSGKELRLAGLRINPETSISSRVNYFNNLKIKNLKTGTIKKVSGYPENSQIANIRLSPDETKIIFTITKDTGVQLWFLDFETAVAKPLTEPVLNAALRSPATWFRNEEALLVKFIPENKKPLIDTDTSIPEGPQIMISTGEKAQNRTYKDLLTSADDEFNFEQLAKSELYKVYLDGTKEKWGESAMYRRVDFSPDGNYVKLTTIKKPFSYIVPYYRFPVDTEIKSSAGFPVKIIEEKPLTEVLPKGFMAVHKGKREISWRKDKPATLVWAVALDQGDPKIEVEYRDIIYQQKVPFENSPKELLKTRGRYISISWCNNDFAVAYDYWRDTRNTKTYAFNPGNSAEKPTVLFDRNYQDKYSEPGEFVLKKNQYGLDVLFLKNNKTFLIGEGYSEKGQFPFVHSLNIKSGKTKNIYTSEYTQKLETIIKSVDIESGKFLVRIESASEFPNYYFRNIYKNAKPEKLTSFKNPFKALQTAHKELIKYTRSDGLKLSGTLYLPAGYDRENKEKLPLIIHAYPREYKTRSSASQTTSNPNKFIYPHYGSMVYWITQGYAVLQNAAFPIVGEGSKEPNDSFIEQLISNAQAAIDTLNEAGYIDTARVAVEGHSYGAFMTANLLSHTNIFAAGIARSGAYNRTLTPFGFQGEERSYWDSPETYYKMSPFMHADKMKTPLLIIHGEADNNSGTHPLQSRRYFHALKGLGAPARLVILPKESHGYRAKESILHLLWEQHQWLEKHVKNK